jgi:hypothetical protein
MSEVFDRLEGIRRAIGRFAESGLNGDDQEELASHARIRERWKAIHARAKRD